MSDRRHAVALWGEAEVARALAHPSPAAPTADFRADVRRHATTDAELAAWSRTLDAASFAALVRLVAGETRRDLLRAVQAADEGMQ